VMHNMPLRQSRWPGESTVHSYSFHQLSLHGKHTLAKRTGASALIMRTSSSLFIICTHAGDHMVLGTPNYLGHKVLNFVLSAAWCTVREHGMSLPRTRLPLGIKRSHIYAYYKMRVGKSPLCWLTFLIRARGSWWFLVKSATSKLCCCTSLSCSAKNCCSCCSDMRCSSPQIRRRRAGPNNGDRKRHNFLNIKAFEL